MEAWRHIASYYSQLLQPMIYTFDDNLVHTSVKQLDSCRYVFYRAGCLVPYEDIDRLLSANQDEIIIAKLNCHQMPNKQVSNGSKWSEQLLRQKWQRVIADLNDNDLELFRMDASSLFQERGKFKYIAARENLQQEDQLTLEQKQQAFAYFTSAHGSLVDCKSEVLEYFQKNWRELLNGLCRSKTEEMEENRQNNSHRKSIPKKIKTERIKRQSVQ